MRAFWAVLAALLPGCQNITGAVASFHGSRPVEMILQLLTVHF
jgi:hypothetical protein